MMTEEDFGKLIERIKALGFDEETACDYAAEIGDTPCVDDEGLTLVVKNGEVVARLKLQW